MNPGANNMMQPEQMVHFSVSVSKENAYYLKKITDKIGISLNQFFMLLPLLSEEEIRDIAKKTTSRAKARRRARVEENQKVREKLSNLTPEQIQRLVDLAVKG